MPIAIVGIGCRFPGGVTDAASFWQLLVEGRDAIGEIPGDRIDLARYYDPRPATPGRMMTRRGGFLERIDEFDASFFGISPREAERLDPQHRLLLETAWEALEDAGQDVLGLDGSATGVFMGQWTSDFENRLFADPEGVDFAMTLGSGRYAAAARVSYVLGLRGPSLSIDAACSSGLACVHLAVRSLRSGECPLALAGATNLILQPHIHVAYSQSRMMSPAGQCRFGDAGGDGYVRSEGVAVVVLKPLPQALVDDDRVYAVIRGSAVNNDGKSSGSMGRPSRIGQVELLRAACADAGVSPGEIGYVEAHGTGTRAGDPVEIAALSEVLAQDRRADRPVWIGSIKTNIGHTEATAGIAGLIKAALIVGKGEIPPSLHLDRPNPMIPWAQVPLSIPTRVTHWASDEKPRVAGVSAYGIGGTNAHVVVESPPVALPAQHTNLDNVIPVLPLSTRSDSALRALASRYASVLTSSAAPRLEDLCAAAANRRSALEHRAAFVATDAESMILQLREYAAGNAPASAEGRVYATGVRPKLAFVIPGQGAQWAGMARELAAHSAVFRHALQGCDDAARVYADFSVLDQLQAEPGSASYRLDQIDVIQPTLVAIAIAFAEWLGALGIKPDAVVGHSMGEVAAAYLAGALDLDQAMRVICRRSSLMRRTSGQGAMALVDLSKVDAAARLRGRDAQVSVAVSNSPRSSVISGDPEAVQQVLDELEREGIFCRMVKVDVASHSPQMEPLALDLVSDLRDLEPRDARVPMYSTVLGARYEGARLDAAYWGRNLRETVRFTDAVNALLDDGVEVFLELSPHPLLTTAIEETARARERSVAALACGRREASELLTWNTALAGLWAAGIAPNWSAALPGKHRHVTLPTYPWQRERHWVDAADLPASADRERSAVTAAKPDDAMLGWLYQPRWIALPSFNSGADAAATWLIAADDESVGNVLNRAATAAGIACRLCAIDAVSAELDRAGTAKPVDVVLIAAGSEADVDFLPVRVLQATLRARNASRPKFWFVTRGAHRVSPDHGHRIAIGHAALWGAARVVGEEHPDLWGGMVDLDPAVGGNDDAARLVAHLRAPDGEDQVALRGDQRFALRLVPFRAQQRAAPVRWRRDATYLITGGLGDIGLHIARTLVADGVRRLVLLGRTPLPPRDQWAGLPTTTLPGRRVAAIRALEAEGAAVHVASVDVADESSLGAFLDRYRGEGWPPIRGVIHAAGLLNNHLASGMDRVAFDAVVTPKLSGARNLDRLLTDLEFFALFSSTGAFIPQAGQANYAAANAGLDAIVLDRRARGLPAQSIAWGVWRNTGLVNNESGTQNVSEMERQGIGSFTPEQGAAMFTWLCGRAEATIAVLPIDWARFREARAGRSGSMFRELTADAASATAGNSAALALANAAPGERRKLLEPLVRDAVGKVLKIAPALIDARKALGAMGLGSLMAMELRNRLEATLGRPLSATLAWNYPTVDAIVAHLAEGTADAPTDSEPVETSTDAPSTPPGSPSLGAALEHVAALSDEEALLALVGRRGGSAR
jgi:acyl transferase domain-containing protein/acyl carrier protein